MLHSKNRRLTNVATVANGTTTWYFCSGNITELEEINDTVITSAQTRLFLCGHTHQTWWALPVFSLSSALNGPCALMWLACCFCPHARLDRSPLIWRGHENNCSRQTGRREIAPAVIFKQLYLPSHDAGICICRKNVLWLTVTVHDLEFVSKFLRME